MNCYIDYLLSEAKSLTEDQIAMLLWETIIETSDTTLVTTEWAMYELAKDVNRQVVSLSSIEHVYVIIALSSMCILYMIELARK